MLLSMASVFFMEVQAFGVCACVWWVVSFEILQSLGEVEYLHEVQVEEVL